MLAALGRRPWRPAAKHMQRPAVADNAVRASLEVRARGRRKSAAELGPEEDGGGAGVEEAGGARHAHSPQPPSTVAAHARDSASCATRGRPAAQGWRRRGRRAVGSEVG
jgi:hypothetical protein